MKERRTYDRLLCADLVELIWCDETGAEKRRVGNLEDISPSGVCLQLETPISMGTKVTVVCADVELVGIVRYAIFRARAYFVGVQLEESSLWSVRNFRPKHLLDVRELLHQAALRALNAPLTNLVQ